MNAKRRLTTKVGCRLVKNTPLTLEEQEEIERYIQGYRQQPQMEGEFGWSDVVVVEYFSEQPWPGMPAGTGAIDSSPAPGS